MQGRSVGGGVAAGGGTTAVATAPRSSDHRATTTTSAIIAAAVERSNAATAAAMSRRRDPAANAAAAGAVVVVVADPNPIGPDAVEAEGEEGARMQRQLARTTRRRWQQDANHHRPGTATAKTGGGFVDDDDTVIVEVGGGVYEDEDGENRCANRVVVDDAAAAGKAPPSPRRAAASSPSSSSPRMTSSPRQSKRTPSPLVQRRMQYQQQQRSSAIFKALPAGGRSSSSSSSASSSSSVPRARPSPSAVAVGRAAAAADAVLAARRGGGSNDEDERNASSSSSSSSSGSSSSSVLRLSEKHRLGPGGVIEVEKDKPTWESRRWQTTAQSDSNYRAAVAQAAKSEGRRAVVRAERASPRTELSADKGGASLPPRKEDDRAAVDEAPGGNERDDVPPNRKGEVEGGTTREDAAPAPPSDFATTRIAWATKLEKQKMKVVSVRKAIFTVNNVDDHTAARKRMDNNVLQSSGVRASDANADDDRTARMKEGDVVAPNRNKDIPEYGDRDGPSSVNKAENNELPSPSLDKRKQLYEKYEKGRHYKGAGKKLNSPGRYEDTVPVEFAFTKDKTPTIKDDKDGNFNRMILTPKEIETDSPALWESSQAMPSTTSSLLLQEKPDDKRGRLSLESLLSTSSLGPQVETADRSSKLASPNLLVHEKPKDMVSMPNLSVQEKPEETRFSHSAESFPCAEDAFAAFKPQWREGPTGVVENHGMMNAYEYATNDEEEMVAFATSAFDSDVFGDIVESPLKNKDQEKNVEDSDAKELTSEWVVDSREFLNENKFNEWCREGADEVQDKEHSEESSALENIEQEKNVEDSDAKNLPSECSVECHEFASESKVNVWCGENANDLQDEEPPEELDAKVDGVAIKVKSFQTGLSGEQQMLLSDIIVEYEAKIVSRTSEVESLKGEMTMQHLQIESLLGKEQEKGTDSDRIVEDLHKEISDLRLQLAVSEAAIQNGRKGRGIANNRSFLSFLKMGSKYKKSCK